MKEKVNSFFKNYYKVIKKITVPTKKQWWETLWKVSLIIIIFGAILFITDYLLFEGILGLQSLMSPLGVRWIEIFYAVAIFLTGVISGVGVLSQQGDDSGGLTAMLGSTVQYGDITGSISKRVSKITFVSSSVFLIMILFSPIFLGGVNA